MAELNFDNHETVEFVPETNVGNIVNETNDVVLDENITIADTEAPIVVLFGPSQCGKTMTLVRLTNYLNKCGYTVAPIKNFRPNYDTSYHSACANFNTLVSQSNAAQSTGLVNYMLVEVIKDGRRLCQILEAPGEYYFDPKHPEKEYPDYMETIIGCNNRKVWCIMVEPDWENHSDCKNYVRKIKNLKPTMRTQDRAVFVFNKIDLTNFVISPGRVNLDAAIKQVTYLYPGIFEPFRNTIPIFKWFKAFNCDFVPFQTGKFPMKDGVKKYVEGPDEYPRDLWNVILNKLRG